MKPRLKGGKYYDESGRRRDGNPAQRRRTFNRAIWDRWWADRTPDERTLELRAGIEELKSKFKQ